MRRAIAAIAETLTARPALCAAIFLVLTFGFTGGLTGLKLDTSATGLIAPSDPAVAAYDEIKTVFGDDVAFTIIYRADPVFTPEILASVDRVSYALEDLDGITRVVSLATVGNLKGEGDVLNTDQVMAYPPETQAEADEIRTNALANEVLVGEVAGPNGDATAISAFVESRPDDRAFERRVLTAIETILAKERETLGDGVAIYVAGSPVVKVAIGESLVADGVLLAPISILTVGAVLLLFFRALIVIVLPVVTGVASICATLGFMGFMGFELNPLSVIIPSLLMVVGATEDIHLISEYAASLGKSADRRTAIRAMLRHGGLAIVLTSLTTTIGFLTLAPHDIPIIKEFGIAASFGMAANFVLTVIAAPLVANLMPAPTHFKRPEPKLLAPIKHWLVRLALRRRSLVIGFSFIFFTVCGVLTSTIVVNNDYLAFFTEDDEVRQRVAAQARDMSGGSILLVDVKTHRDGGVQEPKALADIARLTDFLAERHDDVLSYDLFIRKTHMELNGGDRAYFVVPESADLIAQYTLLIAPATIERFVDFDFSRAMIMVRTRLGGSDAMMRELPILEDFVARELSPSLNVTFSGESVLIARSADTMSREIVTNLGIVFIAIFVILSLLFNSFRAGLLSLAPNLLPIIGVFGAMGLLGIPLGTSVFPVAVIALGIAVDDTIHFMTRYSQELRRHEDNAAAIASTIEAETRPVLSSSVALIAGFLVLLLGDFGSIQQFGLLAAIAMLLAVVADLTVTPALLIMTPIVTTWDLLKARLDPGFAAESAVLRGLKPGELRRVAAAAVVREFDAGERILSAGETGRDMFLILNGAVDVLVDANNQEPRRLGGAARGNVIGELAFLTGAPRSADVVARQKVEALQISAATLDRIERRHPKIAGKLYRNIAVILTERLKSAQHGDAEGHLLA